VVWNPQRLCFQRTNFLRLFLDAEIRALIYFILVKGTNIIIVIVILHTEGFNLPLIIFVDAALIVHVKVSSIQECIRMNSWRLLLAKVTSILVMTLSSLLLLVDLLILEAIWVVIVASTESMLGHR